MLLCVTSLIKQLEALKNSTYLNILKLVVAERLPGKLLTVEHRLHREDRLNVITAEHS